LLTGGALVVAALAIPVTAPAGGENYLPLVIGNRWSYALLGGDTEVVVVDRTATIRGRSVFVFTHTVDATPVEEDYWSESEGDVFYHGYYRPIEDFGVLCDPPVKLVDAPLLPGGTWSTTTELILLPGETSAGSTTFSFAVAGTKELQVPAGTFVTTAIEPLKVSAERDGHGTLAFPTRWVANGVGTIRLGGAVPRNLASYAVVLAVEPATWGSVKWQLGARVLP
jgi:hypothetical protein